MRYNMSVKKIKLRKPTLDNIELYLFIKKGNKEKTERKLHE